jgi:hypothetical protein
MALQAFVSKVFRESTAINLKSTGTTVLIPAQSGKFIPGLMKAHLVTRTGSGTGATMSIGANSATWNNLFSGTGFGGARFANEFFELLYNATSRFVPIDLTSGLKANLTVASTYTTDTGIIYLEGIIIP